MKRGKALIAEWVDAGAFAQNPPNPDYPNGVDVDCSQGAADTCRIDLKCPAPRCGRWAISCKLCSFTGIVTTAGRADDPRSVTVPCQPK
jgi:hypothetical protein